MAARVGVAASGDLESGSSTGSGANSAASNASSSPSNLASSADNAPNVPMDRDAKAELVRVTLVISFYFLISLGMVFLNKLVMDQLDFPYPLFLTWAQFLVALVCIVLFGWLGQIYKPLALIPPFEFDLNIAKKVMPLTIIYLCMVVFNNLCLQYVQVSFYQVARSLTVLWTALFTKLILGKSVSYFRMLAVCVVFIGFVIGSKGEKLFDWGGLIFGVVASIFVALYGIYVKRVLPAVNDNEWRLLIYNTLLALVLLMPIVVIAGEGIVLDPRATDIEVTAFTWAAIFASGLVGFLINIAIFMQIKYTSPLTNAISGTVKAAVQTLLGVVLFGNIISAMNFIGIVVVIGGSFWYGQISYRENEAEKRARLAK